VQAFHTYPIHILVSIHKSWKLYSPSISVDIHPAAPNQKAGAYNMQMVHSWTFQSVWSSGINQESDILKCDFNFLLGGTHGHARGPPRPSWKVYNICWGFATTLLGRSIVYDGSLCQILVSYYESSNFGWVMDISCHWVEATNLFKLNLLYTHAIRSWCNTWWTSSRMKDSFSWRDVTYTYSLKVLLGHLWSAGSFTIRV